MKRAAMFAALLLAACEAQTVYEPGTNETKEAIQNTCKRALDHILRGKSLDGHIIVSYKTRSGENYVYPFPKNSSGNVDAVCVADIYRQQITSFKLDKKLRDGSEFRRDAFSAIPKELRTF